MTTARGESMDMMFQIIGWTGQALFFSRFLIQWLMSERARQVVVPAIFWWLSLGGSILIAIFAVHDRNPIFLAGPVVNAFIYSRNIFLTRGSRPIGGNGLIALILGLLAFAALTLTMKLELNDPLPWLILGIVGQSLWLLRFPLQWFAAERSGVATLPTSFFVCSFFGSCLLLTYAIYRGQALWIAGMTPGPFLYIRGLQLSLRTPPRAKPA